ncbi:MAG: 4-(cytidine 5'-diphospho)-2-C-methyl-D-erythritol kinase [Chloroflexi bacterium]|nr:4-(cytidine 5'-diphospho)-2-C-methyl-D-erythritol kinase [Chloroflexota bacterium]
MIVLRAPAKLNLTLEVLGKRPDGYHEVRSLMQAIDLFDLLTFEPGNGISLACKDPRLASEDNLVLRAARLLDRHTRSGKGARITLEKVIPTGAGLGGGSSDAAATIAGLDELWALGLSSERMADIGAELGSDVPFFVYGGTAIAAGRGEKITPLSVALDYWPVLLFPPLPELKAKTATLYASLRPEAFTHGQFLQAALMSVTGCRPLPADMLYNVFDGAARVAFPGLASFWSKAEGAAGLRFHLAGSGPTLFAWCSQKEEASEVCARLRKRGLHPCLTRTLSRQCQA